MHLVGDNRCSDPRDLNFRHFIFVPVTLMQILVLVWGMRCMGLSEGTLWECHWFYGIFLCGLAFSPVFLFLCGLSMLLEFICPLNRYLLVRVTGIFCW